MKHLITFGSLLFITNVAISQFRKDHYIFRFGIKSVKVVGDNLNFENNLKFKPVADFGFGINYHLSKRLGFQPELHYSSRGYKAKINLTDSTFLTNKYNLGYLDFCPNFNYSFGKNLGGKPTLSLNIGPYFGYRFTGRHIFKGKIVDLNSNKADSTFTQNRKITNLNRIDYGLSLGLGVNFNHYIQVGISYSRGFNNLTLANEPKKYYNNGIGIFMTILFDDMF